MEANNTLDKFGEFLMENLRDSGIWFVEELLKNHWSGTELKNNQKVLLCPFQNTINYKTCVL